MKHEHRFRWNTMMAAETAVFVLLLVLEIIAVPMSDDYRYAINNGFTDIFRREYIQYMTWTGRSVAHILARLFLALPRGIFAVLNSLCYVVLCRVLMYHAQNRKTDNALLFVLIAAMIFVLGPVFGQTVVWETGACNYLWTALIVFSFLAVYRSGKAKCSAVLMFLAGIAAGWTNENTAGAMILMVLLLMILRWGQKEKVYGWMYAGEAGALLGFALMIMAPGNAVRAQDFASTNGRAYDLMHDFFDFITVLKDKMTVLFLLLAVTGALYLLIRRERRGFLTGCCYALCGTAAVFAIILSPVPVVYDRSMFGAALFIITAITLFIDGVLDDRNVYRAAVCIAACLTLFGTLIYAKGLAGMVYTRYLYEQRETYIAEQKAAGNLNPIIPYLDNEFITDMDPLLAGDVSHYRRFWMNEAFAYAHGLESVQAVEADKWRLLYEHGDPQLMNITDLDQYLSAAEDRNDIILLINSTVLDKENYSGLLRILNVHGILEEEDVSVFSVIYDAGIVAQNTGTESSWLETVYYDHYFYLQGTSDPVYSDIAVDGAEYSIDSSGITIVAYDPVKGCAVDSVTWNPESDQGGIRFKAE